MGRADMSAGVSLLPNEPRIDLDGIQAALTEQHLHPAIAALEAFLLHLRAELDPALRERQPFKLGKPYPLGQCLEISKAVQERLAAVDEAALPPMAAAGWRALYAFYQAGGRMRQVWGDLRGQYFQNAFQVGTLYVDVSNDTVTPTKPKVEILPFEEANFTAIRDYRHYGSVAERYWGETAYPNHVLPALAPHCPLIHVNGNGRIQLRAVSDYMLALTRSRAFVPSETVLGDAPMPQALFERMRQALQDSGHDMPETPEQGRQQSLSECHRQRAQGRHQSQDALARLVDDAMALNRVLGSRTSGKVLKIGDTDYRVGELSDEMRARLKEIESVDAELAGLQARANALQATRNASIAQLKAMLAAAERGYAAQAALSNPGTGQRPGASVSPASQATTASSAGGAKP